MQHVIAKSAKRKQREHPEFEDAAGNIGREGKFKTFFDGSSKAPRAKTGFDRGFEAEKQRIEREQADAAKQKLRGAPGHHSFKSKARHKRR